MRAIATSTLLTGVGLALSAVAVTAAVGSDHSAAGAPDLAPDAGPGVAVSAQVDPTPGQQA